MIQTEIQATTVYTKSRIGSRRIPLDRLLAMPYNTVIRSFRPKIRIVMEKERFILKTAENGDELKKALRLRHEVYYQELLSKRHFLDIDMDRFDVFCDHLLVIEKSTGSCVGTYRMLSSTYSRSFYSETEFHAKPVLALPGNKVELGRACIHRDYRQGSVISLLWKGISEYLKRVEGRWFFGCSSVKTEDLSEAACIYHFLQAKHMAPAELSVYPRSRFLPGDLKPFLSVPSKAEIDAGEILAKKLIPPLLLGYLKAGAMVCGIPAHDRQFHCFDFLTLMDMNKLNPSHERKFTK